MPVKFQAATVRLKVVALFGASGVLPTNYIVTPDAFVKGGLTPLDSLLFVTKDDSADAAAVRTSGRQDHQADLPTVTVKDPGEYAEEQRQQVNIFLYFIYALLGLAVVIAVLGIINTLALSVIERTREVGLLRAVGLSRRQLRLMVRLEAVVVSVLGAVLGVTMGLVFGVVLQRAIADQGVDVLSIPWLQLVIFVALAAVAGVLAAVLPARRAARLDVLPGHRGGLGRLRVRFAPFGLRSSASSTPRGARITCAGCQAPAGRRWGGPAHAEVPPGCRTTRATHRISGGARTTQHDGATRSGSASWGEATAQVAGQSSVPNPTGHRSQASPKGFPCPRRSRRSLAHALVLLGAVARLHRRSAHPAEAMSHQARDRVVHVAASKAGTPYAYGADGPRAFDCSGYTKWVFSRMGRHLPRTASAQSGAVRHVSRCARHRGDLVFFRSGGHVYHVAHLRRAQQRLALPASGPARASASTSGPARSPTAGCADPTVTSRRAGSPSPGRPACRAWPAGPAGRGRPAAGRPASGRPR